jgi:hypothetical protein
VHLTVTSLEVEGPGGYWGLDRTIEVWGRRETWISFCSLLGSTDFVFALQKKK